MLECCLLDVVLLVLGLWRDWLQHHMSSFMERCFHKLCSCCKSGRGMPLHIISVVLQDKLDSGVLYALCPVCGWDGTECV